MPSASRRPTAVAVVTVDNPPVNALGDAVLEQLGATATSARRRTPACGPSCSPVPATRPSWPAPTSRSSSACSDGARLDRGYVAASRRALGLVEAMPQPVIAAVQASAMGGGLEVALVCDLIVADPEARLGLPEVRLGLMPGAGGTSRLPQRIGIGPARELLLLGRRRHGGGGSPPRPRRPGVGSRRSSYRGRRARDPAGCATGARGDVDQARARCGSSTGTRPRA